MWESPTEPNAFVAAAFRDGRPRTRHRHPDTVKLPTLPKSVSPTREPRLQRLGAEGFLRSPRVPSFCEVGICLKISLGVFLEFFSRSFYS
jgi:hypothetical protein